MESVLANLKSQLDERDIAATKIEQAHVMMTMLLGIGSAVLMGVIAWFGMPLPYMIACGTGVIVTAVAFTGIDPATNAYRASNNALVAVALLDRMARELDRHLK